MGAKTKEAEQYHESPRAKRSRQYPQGNHLWVNTERLLVSVGPLKRSKSLDELAREHAEEMAEECEVSRCYAKNVTTDIQENCFKGPSIQSIHQLTMCTKSKDRDHILNPNFKEFGMGAVKGADNNLYICQLFC